jgi:hypothetical protein
VEEATFLVCFISVDDNTVKEGALVGYIKFAVSNVVVRACH